MNRRTVLLYLAALPTIAATSCLKPTPSSVQSFFVAGARFFQRRSDLRKGDAVLLQSRVVNQQPALAVCDSAGQQIGWVPRSLIRTLTNAKANSARLVKVSPNSVPWKWYQVEVKT